MDKIKKILKQLNKYDFNNILDNIIMIYFLTLIFIGMYNILDSYNNFSLLSASMFTAFSMLFYIYVSRK
jgi:hypothetical protein